MEEDYNRPDEPKVCNHYNYRLEGDKWNLREDSFRDKNLITTPGWIVKDMLDLLPDSVWNTETTFLIPCIKSGNFAIEVKNRLFKCKDAMERFPDPVDRRNHIDSKQLFCIYWYTEEEFNKNLISGHIWGVTGFLEAMYSPSVNFMCTDDLNFDTFKDKTGKKQEKLLESIKEKFGTVKFDVVIGNPPYNNDLYIDFVQWGHQRARQYSLWITPAKWQAKGGDKNERFRQTIVPHMSKIVYYPDAFDIFDIRDRSGICYYLLDKNNTVSKCNVVNISKLSKSINSEQCRNLHGLLEYNDTILNIVSDIRKKIGAYKPFDFSKCFNGKDFEVYTGKNLSTGHGHLVGGSGGRGTNAPIGSGGLTFTLKGQLNVISNSEVVPKGKYPSQSCVDCTFKSDSELECKSFISYLECKLVKFLVWQCISARFISFDNEHFRFVPDPGAFDHIFTDQELYDKYKLTDEEIHIIESIIKERK